MKPYEEIKFPNGHLRWIREGKEYVCRMTEEYMEKIKNQHEQKPEWQGLTEDEFKQIMLDTYNIDLNAPGHSSDDHLLWRAIEAKLRSKNACEENATDPSKEDWDSACNSLAEARTIPNPEFDKAHTQHKPNTA